MIPPKPWRVVLVTRILPVALGFYAAVREAGHAPVGLLTVRWRAESAIGELLAGAPEHLDVVVPSSRARIAPLLAPLEPDLVVCMGFPWKVPADALGLPRLGWLNGHPSLLSRHRGPIPVAWTIRDGDPEAGISFHRMDAELDTGPVLAQRSLPIGEYAPPDELFGRMAPLIAEALTEALERLAAGEEGTPQEGGDYQSFFGAADARLDLARTAAELHRLVWAWRYAFAPDGTRGAQVELDGETLLVHATSLAEVEGARRVECADAPLWIVESERL